MALDQIVEVLALAAGASVVVPHNVALLPNRVTPDRPTPIGVTTVTTTAVTFTNHGNQPESAYFWVKRDHSIQQAGNINLYWQGFAGFNSFKLDTVQWNDLLTPLVTLGAGGLNPPRLVSQANDGTVVPGYALSFDGAGAVAAIPDFGDYTIDYSVSFWLNSSYGGGSARTVLEKANTLRVQLRSGSLRVRVFGMAEQTVPGFVLGTKNCISIVVTAVAAAVTKLEVWINGVLQTNITFPTALAADNANAWKVMATNLAGVMDEIRFHQAALTADQAAEFYNAGAGTEAALTGSPTLLAGFHCNEGNGAIIDNYEGTAARDGALTDVLWLPGLVGAAGTPGVFAYEFMPGEMMDLLFSIQMNHGWQTDSDYDLHVHWAAPVLDGGDTTVVFGIELQIANIGEVWPALTTVYTVEAKPNDYAANRHNLTTIIELPGSGRTLSHIVRGRVFRLGTGADDFPLPIVIDNIDSHYQIDTLGSRTEATK